jgi:hypothetical protein
MWPELANLQPVLPTAVAVSGSRFATGSKPKIQPIQGVFFILLASRLSGPSNCRHQLQRVALPGGNCLQATSLTTLQCREYRFAVKVSTCNNLPSKLHMNINSSAELSIVMCCVHCATAQIHEECVTTGWYLVRLPKCCKQAVGVSGANKS